MRIALVVHDFDPRYGQGLYCVELVRHLAAQHDIHVYANTCAATISTNFTFHCIPAWRRTALGTTLSFIRAAERQLRRQTFDVVHAQGLSCWRADVITAHICLAARRNATTPASIRRRLSSWLILPLERLFYRQTRAAHLIAVSRRVAADITTCYRWTRPASVIYHGIAADQFQPPASAQNKTAARLHFGLPPTAWVWLFIGEAAKGLRLVIERLPDFPEARLLVVSRSDLQPYRRLARQVGREHQIKFWGPVDPPLAAYQAADVLAYPSDYDAFGLVVGEAMACALPVIVGQRTGAAEWIQPGRNGLLCDPSTAASLYGQLASLRADPVRASSLGIAARETVRQYTWAACAARTLAVYESGRKTRSAS